MFDKLHDIRGVVLICLKLHSDYRQEPYECRHQISWLSHISKDSGDV